MSLALLDLEDHAWREQRACRYVDTEIFFPSRYDPQDGIKAKSICAKCPVLVECLEFALASHEMHGVWGGTSERERRRIRKERNQAARA